jgi:hypothetical protein
LASWLHPLRLPVGRLAFTAHLKAGICLRLSSARVLRPGLPSPGRASPHASSLRNYQRYGNMNPFPIDYASRPRLRGRLTLGRLPLPRNPQASGGQVFHLSFRYSCLHPHFRFPPAGLTSPPSSACGTLPYHWQFLLRNCQSAASVTNLSPVTLSAHDYSTSELLRTLSRYGCF